MALLKWWVHRNWTKDHCQLLNPVTICLNLNAQHTKRALTEATIKCLLSALELHNWSTWTQDAHIVQWELHIHLAGTGDDRRLLQIQSNQSSAFLEVSLIFHLARQNSVFITKRQNASQIVNVFCKMCVQYNFASGHQLVSIDQMALFVNRLIVVDSARNWT